MLIYHLKNRFGVKGVNVTHQSILALYAYNATSGIVVDIGERMDIVPVIDGLSRHQYKILNICQLSNSCVTIMDLFISVKFFLTFKKLNIN